jgi:HEAT repeat protein
MLLESDNREIRESAIWAAGIIGDERFVMPLLRSCRAEEFRNACIAALTRLGAGNMQGLISLYPDASPEDRCLIVYLVGETRYGNGPALIAEALHDGSPVLKRVAAIAAGKIGLHELVPDIVELLEEDDPQLRSGAIESLGHLAGSAPQKVRDVAVRLAGDADPRKRKEAVSLLLVVHDIDRLALLAKDEDAAVRCVAVQALSGVDSHDISGHLIMALVDEDAPVRIAAAGALGTVGGGDAVHALLLALHDEDPWAQCAVVRALGVIGDRIALPAVTELVAGAEGFVVIEALNTLAGIDLEQSKRVIAGALDNGDADVVKAAIETLADCEDTSWIEERRDMLLAHPDWDVRCRFIRLLADRLGSAAFPALRSRLVCETDVMVRGLLNDILGRGC